MMLRENVRRLAGAWMVILVISQSVAAQELSQRSTVETDATKAKIQALLSVQTEAWNRGDLERFMDTYWRSDRLTFSAGGATTRGWQATLDRYRRKYSTAEAMGQLNFSDLEIQLLETRSALVLGKWQLKFANQSSREGNFSLFMTQIENQWRIIHDHSSELKE